MSPELVTEICVVGGGPAGAAIARQLALLGHQVCLVEKAAFPRAHIGESLPPSILPVLDLLDLRPVVESAGFCRPQSAFIRWSTHLPFEKPYEPEAGLLVDRGRFDQLLLEAAQTTGVTLLQPAAAGRPTTQGQNQWTLPVRTPEGKTTIKAQFLINATGKHSGFDRQVKHHAVTTLALYGYWHDTAFQPGESFVEAGANEWFWGAALPDGSFNAAVFLAAERYAAARPHQRTAWYRSLLAQAPLLKGCLEGHLSRSVQVCDASFYLAPDPIGPDWLKVGDAAFAIDPLSAQGVQMALLSALQGGIAAHTLLTQPAKTEAVCSFYRHKIQETVTRSKTAAAYFYAAQNIYPASPFWQQRSQPPAVSQPAQWPQNTRLFELSDRIRLSPSAQLITTPVIQNNAIELIPALYHPSLESPMAYLGDVEMAALLELVTPGQTILELVQQWRRQHDLSMCWQILQWCWGQDILVLAAALVPPTSLPTVPSQPQLL
ncbi:MAG: tryptophan halogenase [Leptolyngbya sp. SIOISBB]|nr:tryptophan halogenase [Leptolyngbya sp. SIOISBB]